MKQNTNTESKIAKKYESIKLGIDWHATQYRVVRIIENAGPEPAQRFTPEKFLQWADKQVKAARNVYSCYEAGSGGFVLHRQLTAMGVTNYVIAPRDLDRDHKRVQNDATDARELAQDLDRFVRGNKKALRLAYVPTDDQEQKRQLSRQRLQMRAHRLSLASQGRSLLLAQGIRVSNNWWRSERWVVLRPKLPQWIAQAVDIYYRLIMMVQAEFTAITKSLEEAAPALRPKGAGALGLEELQREVCDWGRFKNRKAIASYSGLAGGVSATNDNIRDLPITKAGNRRLRTMLIEMAWRWVCHQRTSRQVQRWSKVLLAAGVHRRARKRAIVALARQLLVDLWRWQTGRANPEQFGWIMCRAT